MTGEAFPAPETLVPHTGEIVLLDEVTEIDDASLEALATVRADGLFNTSAAAVPSFIAVEYMAQGVAAWAGFQGRKRGEAVRPGLLLGVRDFQASAPNMAVGSVVRIRVSRTVEMPSGPAVFDATLEGSDLHISARLSVLTVESMEELKRLAAKQEAND